MEKIKANIEDLQKVQENSLSSGYMVGLYNGLELAKSCVTGEEPKYKENLFTEEKFQTLIAKKDKRIAELEEKLREVEQ